MIKHIRMLSFLEARYNPKRNIPELGWLEKYFSGEYLNKQIE